MTKYHLQALKKENSELKTQLNDLKKEMDQLKTKMASLTDVQPVTTNALSPSRGKSVEFITAKYDELLLCKTNIKDELQEIEKNYKSIW